MKYTDSYVLRFARDLNSDTKQYYITRRYYYVFIRVDVVCIFTVQNGHSAKTFRYYYLFFFHYYLFPVQHGWKKTSVTRVMQVLHILLHAFATSCWPTAPPPPPSWFSVPIRPARVDDDGETRTFLSRRNIRSARPIRPTFCVRSRFGRVVYRSPAAAWYPQKRTTTHNITVSRRRHNNIYRTEPIPCDRVEKNPRRYSLYRGFGISLFSFTIDIRLFDFERFRIHCDRPSTVSPTLIILDGIFFSFLCSHNGEETQYRFVYAVGISGVIICTYLSNPRIQSSREISVVFLSPTRVPNALRICIIEVEKHPYTLTLLGSIRLKFRKFRILFKITGI